MTRSPKLLLQQFLLVVFLLAAMHQAWGEPAVSDGSIRLPLPAGTSQNEFTWLEQSTDLIKWTPVARDYGFDWQNTFPHLVDISGESGNRVFSKTIDGEIIYFRMASAQVATLTNPQTVSRFLQQATFGPTRELISTFPGIDVTEGFNLPPYAYFEQWIDQQIAAPLFSHRKFFRERSNPSFVNNPQSTTFEVGYNPSLGHQLTYNIGQNRYYPPAIDPSRPLNDVEFPPADTKRIVWYQAAITADDPLRQRVAWALSQFFVLGEDGSNQLQHTERFTSFYDIFVRNAFGNFLDILTEVTWHPAMGYYLTSMDNRAFHVSGSFPDENYAREVMQLFTIGLWMLNQDGSLIVDEKGDPIPTYDNEDITEFAKIFTGMRRQTSLTNIEWVGGNYVTPMRMQASWHDFSEKTLLNGSRLSAPAQTAEGAIFEINSFLQHLFNHPNTAPFFARLMIQRLTVSNPSPGYISAVSHAFITGLYNGKGTGQRGDMTAVIKAILLHPEARAPALAYDDAHGKLREPLVRLMHYARAFKITSVQTYGFFPFTGLEQAIAQSPYEAPSVFNFYQVSYQPLGEILDRDLNAPEFQIHTDLTSLSLANAIRTLVEGGIVGMIGRRGYSQAHLDLSYEITLADNIPALLDHLDIILSAGRLSDQNRQILMDRLMQMPAATDQQKTEIVRKALSLYCLLPEFNVIY